MTTKTKLPDGIKVNLRYWEDTAPASDISKAMRLSNECLVSKDTMPRSIASVEIFWECECGKDITGEWTRHYSTSDIYAPSIPWVALNESDEFMLFAEDGYVSTYTTMLSMAETLAEYKDEHVCSETWRKYEPVRKSLVEASNRLAKLKKEQIYLEYSLNVAIAELERISGDEMYDEIHGN